MLDSAKFFAILGIAKKVTAFAQNALLEDIISGFVTLSVLFIRLLFTRHILLFNSNIKSTFET